MGDSAVVYSADFWVGDPGTQLAGELAVAFGDGGGLQRVAAGFVEDDAAEAVFDGDGHFPGGAIAGGEHDHRLAGGFPAYGSRVDGIEHFKAHAASGGAGTGLVLAVFAGHGLGEETGTDLAVAGEEAVGVGDEDLMIHVDESRLHLGDAFMIALGGGVGGAEDLRLPGIGGGVGDDPDGVDVAEEPLGEKDLTGSGSV